MFPLVPKVHISSHFFTPRTAPGAEIGVGALSRHRRWWGLGAFVCDGIARETVEGRGTVSGSLAGMFPLVPKVHIGSHFFTPRTAPGAETPPARLGARP